MSAKDKQKANRKAQKSVLTRLMNTAERYVAEESKDNVKSTYDKIYAKFKEFEEAHMTYHDNLTDEKEIDDSDKYFFEVQKKTTFLQLNI